MLKSYLKTSFRNLLRHKGYSFINIFGLTIGLASSIFILLWVIDELSFDRFHSNADRIFSVYIKNENPDGRIDTYPATPSKLKEAIVNEIPEIELATQYSMQTELLVKNESNAFNERGIYADATLFRIFNFPIINGNPTNPLTDIKSIAISKKLADKLFVNVDPIGKTLYLGESHELVVTSVFDNIPENSSLQFDFVASFKLFVKENPWTQNWGSGGTKTVVMLKDASYTKAANDKLSNLIKRNCVDCTTSPFLFPYYKSRLYAEFDNGKNTGGRIQQVVLFSAVAILILLMACVNFINLSTARSATRSREVGVRKSIGAQKSGLVIQFIIESILQSFIALIFALAIVQLLLPFFNNITTKSIQLDLSNPILISGIMGITLICGFLAGSYPAFVLSRFNAAKVLKGNSQFGLTGNSLRKSLVVFQFVTSAILIVGSIAVHKQIVFISERNLGFQKDNIIVVDQNEGIVKNYAAIKNDLNQVPAINSIAFGGSNIFTIPITTMDPSWVGKPHNSSIAFKIYRCDAEFIPTMSIKILRGRNFLEGQDASNYIINKKAAEVMGLSLENAEGAALEMWNGKGKIIGITDDFHNDNLRYGIEPMIFMYSENLGAHYFVNINGQVPVTRTIEQIAEIFEKHNPEYPFEYTFLDEVFNREYRAEIVSGKLSLSFTILAILISCLGLFGLASFTAERRTKELGIRKVMGASIWNLVVLLSKDFTSLVILSLFIGFPISWFLVGAYLSDFAFRVEISWSIYILTSIFMLLLTFLSVGFQSAKSAISNPVDALRNE